jgi:hypothetical protein
MAASLNDGGWKTGGPLWGIIVRNTVLNSID